MVSAVKSCKQCMQAASASEDFVYTRPLGYSSQMKIPGTAIGHATSKV